MEVTSSSSTWSHRPEPDLIGVSVFQRQNQFSLRFHLRATHLERINKPKTLGIRGSAQNGFILTPNSETGVKPSRVAKSDLFYVMQTLNKFNRPALSPGQVEFVQGLHHVEQIGLGNAGWFDSGFAIWC